jgi:hypothetical protein
MKCIKIFQIQKYTLFGSITLFKLHFITHFIHEIQTKQQSSTHIKYDQYKKKIWEELIHLLSLHKLFISST